MRDDFEFGGLVKFSTLDYPDHTSAVLFTKGCPCKCPYCHNWNLNDGSAGSLSWGQAREFLESRVGVLSAVVITGGEPMLMGASRMSSLIGCLRQMGFLVKLDTCGLLPGLAGMRNRPDYLAIDIKAPAGGYGSFYSGYNGSNDLQLRESLDVILECGGEVRTTVHRHLTDEADLQTLRSQYVEPLGQVPWYLQQFRPSDGIRNPELARIPTYSDEELAAIAVRLGARIRGVPDYLAARADLEAGGRQ